MADIQPQSPASGDDSGSDAGPPAPPAPLAPTEPTPTCARCVKRVILDPTKSCVLHQQSQRARKMNADTKCTYCQCQRARCYKCPSALKPEILELQQRARDYNTWVDGQNLLPPALRSTWVLPKKMPNPCPINAPDVYKELHRAQKVVEDGIPRAQKGISGWKTMRKGSQHEMMGLNPVVRNGDNRGYWW
ncbi:hypothetical protein BELL_0139g00010 [Botrytis elliptica]|uniref:Uncharacterized protein n=1 Tax=Botrytis elliptica TaxID=278938 RepID=A0A4Z1JTD4_9HELO|nr:hypothetical protein EAE99_003832 [Botrytis elliptica]TGO76736.1 hypothetical protein BELL_0139g00010 [Botrytis elliptica]